MGASLYIIYKDCSYPHFASLSSPLRVSLAFAASCPFLAGPLPLPQLHVLRFCPSSRWDVINGGADKGVPPVLGVAGAIMMMRCTVGALGTFLRTRTNHGSPFRETHSCYFVKQQLVYLVLVLLVQRHLVGTGGGYISPLPGCALCEGGKSVQGAREREGEGGRALRHAWGEAAADDRDSEQKTTSSLCPCLSGCSVSGCFHPQAPPKA
eukprot:1521216-Rhodomonas_salina.1